MVNRDRPDTYWMTPAPLWVGGYENYRETGRPYSQPPVILRFVTDSFMDEFNDLLSTEPERMAEYCAHPETWRGFTRPVLPEKETESTAPLLNRLGLQLPLKKAVKKAQIVKPLSIAPLKLYQPAHQRFYLVTSSLICDDGCMQDQSVDPGRNEKTGFVVRRLWPSVKTKPEDDLGFPDSTWKEYAFISQPDGNFAWSLIEDREYQKLQSKEEMLPLFPVSYANECQVHNRRIWAGLVPVGRREAYMGAMAVNSPTTSSSTVTQFTARKVLFRTQIAEPWKSLVDTATSFNEMMRPTSDECPPEDVFYDQLKKTRGQIQTVSWLILADFRQFMMDYNRTVWDQVAAKTPGQLTGAKRTLYDTLHSLKLNPILAQQLTANMGSGSPQNTVETLADALRQMEPQVVAKMESSYGEFQIGGKNPDCPGFLFPLTDPEISSLNPFSADYDYLADDGNDEFDLKDIMTREDSAIISGMKSKIDKLTAVVLRALDETFTCGEPAVPVAAMGPADLREGWFVIRCVYQRPLCPLHTEPDILSLPSIAFQMAGFFDPDAPARPIRIGLPLDTTPSGLRKFNKNTAFVISDVLCGQMKRLKGITFGRMVRSVLPWPFYKKLPGGDGTGGPCKKGGINMGTICSFSIPIITLCAMILLMVMVALFDLIFHWIPFFYLCFPIPGLRAKRK